MAIIDLYNKNAKIVGADKQTQAGFVSKAELGKSEFKTDDATLKKAAGAVVESTYTLKKKYSDSITKK